MTMLKRCTHSKFATSFNNKRRYTTLFLRSGPFALSFSSNLHPPDPPSPHILFTIDCKISWLQVAECAITPNGSV